MKKYEFLTVEEFSKLSGFSEYVIRSWIKNNQIPCTRAGAKILINATLWEQYEIEKWEKIKQRGII